MPVMSVKSDREIQEDVLQELRWDSRIREAEVGVEVDKGVVTLTGTVDSWAKKLAAKEGTSLSLKARDLIREALELYEEGYWLRKAKERDKTFVRARALTHDEVWK